ncbi:hypothetical protein EI42_04804 [Thermosporothrix hazakensis]|jgi:formate hydrogenlyase subunit 3/multisubunit Na+/H+ antiporter MnhD subunit|uniref:DUF6249 domain-containing protein n=2 Tax=Thermosporothrix TaxID=768650 RepID=A0A326U1Q2_THEHA|nr:DUF6249 domain-containing protein [Thermosporothrix hazakensis]PZW23881.1 hypothetical protein EI42_04804 [Thermosporothrix hazakensis]BBH90463.1 hypothetical protein KTC_52140 [Thermosporothrix sp. COM3]GCE48515.1 hypothetical protein KTH_33840 [Thermosporothrix hazakensis]
MSLNVLVVLLGWLFALAIFLGFIILLRYLHHRERMELIRHGFSPDIMRRLRRSRGILRAGLITCMVGIALMAGLYPIGFFLPDTFPQAPLHLGPWLLPGLIPFAVGLALIGSYYLEHSHAFDDEQKASKDVSASNRNGEGNVVPFDHRDGTRKESL